MDRPYDLSPDPKVGFIQQVVATGHVPCKSVLQRSQSVVSTAVLHRREKQLERRTRHGLDVVLEQDLRALFAEGSALSLECDARSHGRPPSLSSFSIRRDSQMMRRKIRLIPRWSKGPGLAPVTRNRTCR